MCGIAGIYGFEGDEGALRRRLDVMGATMVHRGPDGCGVHVDSGLRTGLVVRRLAIVDPEHGEQPMYSEDGTVAVVCNGEIYNHLALRQELEGKGYRLRSRSDCEVLAHLYREEGVDFLNRLEGMFALALLDKRDGSLLLARDPVGMKNLYWGETPAGFVFSSEARPLFAAGLVTPRPDWVSLGSYMAIGWVPSPGTAFAGLQRLQPGSCLQLRQGKVRHWRYWIPRFAEPERERDEGEYAEELRGLLDHAVGTHLAADVPVGLFLSGGWDSSLVSLYAARRASRPLKSWSLVFPDDPETDESEYARAVSRQIGAHSVEIEVRERDVLGLLTETSLALEEPVTTCPTQLGYLLSRHAGHDVKVVLGGEGSDEMFAGYHRFWPSPLHRIRQAFPHALFPQALPFPMGNRWRRALRFLAAEDDEQAHVEFLSLSMPRELQQFLAPGVPLEVRPGPAAIGYTDETRATFRDRLDMQLSLEFTGRLADGILFAHDKTSMAHSLEVRMPFLDPAVVDFAHRLPSRFKVRGRQMKAVLAPLARELPPAVARRPKQGLGVPWRIYRSPALREFFEETIIGTSRRSGLFDHRRLEPWVRTVAATDGPRAAGLWPICHFCLWWDLYMEGDAEGARAVLDPLRA